MEAMGDNIRIFYFLFEEGGRERLTVLCSGFAFTFMDVTGCAGKESRE